MKFSKEAVDALDDGAPTPSKLEMKIDLVQQEMNFLSQAYGISRENYTDSEA